MKTNKHSPDGLARFMRLQLRYKALLLSPFLSGIVMGLLVSYPVGQAVARSLGVNPDVALNTQPSGLLVVLCFLALFCGVMVAVFVGGFALIRRYLRESHSPETAKAILGRFEFPEAWYAR